MTEPRVGDEFSPGSIVPASGIYRCDNSSDDHPWESTDVKGNRFPPLPHGCGGSKWVLKIRTSHH